MGEAAGLRDVSAESLDWRLGAPEEEDFAGPSWVHDASARTKKIRELALNPRLRFAFQICCTALLFAPGNRREYNQT